MLLPQAPLLLLYLRRQRKRRKDKVSNNHKAQFTRYRRRRHENTSHNFSSSAHQKEQEQSRPRIWMKVCRLRDPNYEHKEKENSNYCAICNPEGQYVLVIGQTNQIGLRIRRQKMKKRYCLKSLIGIQIWRRHIIIMPDSLLL